MIGVDGQVLTLKDRLFPTDKLLISSEKCKKLIAKGASGYWLCSVQPDTINTEALQSPVSEPVSTLLHQFQDIFQPPVGLPPPRHCDHQILLFPDAKPPNIRPYRMSHSQKNVVEQVIKEMLKNKEIRISKSPFSSPVILVRKKDKS
jgi:hypothetical protein